MTERWMTSADLGLYLNRHRNNDVKVAFGNNFIPIADIHYDSDADSYIIELAASIDLWEALHPELWGTAQAADYLGISKQHVHQLTADHPNLLAPLAKFPGSRGTRVWLAKTWKEFAETGPQQLLRKWRDLHR